MSNAREYDKNKDFTDGAGLYHVEKEPLIVYKKVADKKWNAYVIKCEIPIGARIVISKKNYRALHGLIHDKYVKLRCDKLIPIGYARATDFEASLVLKNGKRFYRNRSRVFIPELQIGKGTIYRINKESVPDFFNTEVKRECVAGLHFFLTEEEALEW